MGAIALYEKNPDIMYVGLGEPQLRQSVSWGDGMYKTVDGGETWQHIGLTDSLHIANVRIHPDNPDLVYVSSMGHAFGPTEEKGVFRTKDGGKTWENILFESEKTGAIDLVMSASNPDVLFAALWEFERKAWGAKTGGPESGIYRSLDGGDSWEEISENDGMPDGMMGPRRPRPVEGRPRARLCADRLREPAGALPLRRPGQDLAPRLHGRQHHRQAVLPLSRVRQSQRCG